LLVSFRKKSIVQVAHFYSATLAHIYSALDRRGIAMVVEDMNKKPTASKMAIIKRFLFCEEAFIIVSSVIFCRNTSLSITSST